MMRYDPWPFPADPKDDSELVRMARSARELEARVVAVREERLSKDAYFARHPWSDRNPETGRYWLWRMHHRDNEIWKCLGRPNWSVLAYTSWRRQYLSVPLNARLGKDGHPALATLPKQKAGLLGLRHEHVVPMNLMLQGLLADEVTAQEAVRLNQDAIILVAEDRLLDKSGHPDIRDPWRRYAGTGIKFIPNPTWSPARREALDCYGLIATEGGM